MSNMAEISNSVRRFLLLTVFSSINSKAFYINYAFSSFGAKYHNSTEGCMSECTCVGESLLTLKFTFCR